MPPIQRPSPVLESKHGLVRHALRPTVTPPRIPTHLLPSLPTPLRSQSSLPSRLRDTHSLSTHIVKAAWPRLPSHILDTAAHEPPLNETKAQRKARSKARFEEVSRKKAAQENETQGLGDTAPRPELLFNTVNRYARKDAFHPEGLTIVVVHAIGFPKEVCALSPALLLLRPESCYLDLGTRHSGHG